MSFSQPPPIGRNIARARKKKTMSLDELSKRAGVSKSMLSQIEQEKTNPTVVTVWKIARALDTPVHELIDTGEPDILEVIRSGDAPVIQTEDRKCIFRINTPIHTTDNLEIYRLTMKSGGKNESLPHFPHAEEFLTVVEGKIRVVSGGTETIVEKGDTVRYKADVEHILENVYDKDSEALLVVWFPK